MRLLEDNYGRVKIFSERPYGYKRFVVCWLDGETQIYSGLWYKHEQVIDIVEKQLINRGA